MQDEEEEKDGEEKVVARKSVPRLPSDSRWKSMISSWYVVRNTPGVTGFVGTTTKPIPLTDEEAQRITQRMNTEKGGCTYPTSRREIKIRITQGAFADNVATVYRSS